jgi:hypothetical protein
VFPVTSAPVRDGRPSRQHARQGGRKESMLPEIQVDLWAMTTAIHLGLKGYVRIG